MEPLRLPHGPARALLVAAALAIAVPTPAPAQEQPAVADLRLLAQSPAVTAKRPLTLTIQLTNPGAQPLEDLVVSLWVYNPARSRTEYAQGLAGEPPTEPFLVQPFPQRLPLGPGETRQVAIRRKLPELAARGENALYPVKVQLESAGAAIGQLRSALVFIGERPLVPLNVSLVFVLDAPIRYRPDGTFLDTELESQIAQGGRLDAIVASLEAHPVRATLAVSPLLVEQLQRMAAGYRVLDGGAARAVPPEAPEAARAGALLERIRGLALSGDGEIVALPYASPLVPSLVHSGLQGDLARQIQHGRTVLEQVLGAQVQASILYPPGSAITSESLEALPPEIQTLILGSDALPPPPDLVLSPPATAFVGESHQAAVPDPGFSVHLEPSPDPRLAAQQAIGDLSAVYFEKPSVLRGTLLLVDEGAAPDPLFLQPFLRALASPPPGAEWLRPTRVSQLLAAVPPDHRRRLRSTAATPFSASFLDDLRDGRAAIQQFESMAGEAALPTPLDSLLLVAESRGFTGRESTARQFLGAVEDSLAREFDKVRPPDGSSVTLTSQGGVIPVTMRNGAEYEVHIRVSLRSPRLEFLEGSTQEVTLPSGSHALTFPVRAQTTGRFPVRILVETPSGRRIAESRIVVRSTAYNRIALAVTIGAALFLAAWWGRRLVRRARS